MKKPKNLDKNLNLSTETDLNHGLVFICCAFQKEATPLIEELKLSRINSDQIFPCYVNSQKSIWLIVGGIGKFSAAAATGFFAGKFYDFKPAFFMSFGCAGHKDLDLGSLVLAHKITESSSGRCFYPPQIWNFSFESKELLTLDEPSDYYGSELLEMEAFGFCSAAKKFVSHEWILALKIISDNQNYPFHQGSPEKTQSLIQEKIDDISKFIHELLKISSEQRKAQGIPEEYEDLIKNKHFTVSQKHQIKPLIYGLKSLLPQLNLMEISQGLKAKEIIALFKEKLIKGPHLWN